MDETDFPPPARGDPGVGSMDREADRDVRVPFTLSAIIARFLDDDLSGGEQYQE